MLRFLASVGIALGCLVALLAIVAAWILLTTPRPTDIRDCLVARMYQVPLCPSKPGYATLRSIAPIVRQAVVASEDGSFYDHRGFDWFEMRESFERNWAEGRFARGGSTITQQLAKNVYLTKDKSVLRKLREALIVVQLEKALSKDEILEKYLNVVELGPGVFGITAASFYYFQKPPARLGPVEASFIAFLLPNPKKYSASFRAHKLTKFARGQVKAILGRLWKMKKLSEEQYQSSLFDVDRIFGVAPDMRDEGAPSPDEGDSAPVVSRAEPAPDLSPSADAPAAVKAPVENSNREEDLD